MKEPVIATIAKKHNASPAQVSYYNGLEPHSQNLENWEWPGEEAKYTLNLSLVSCNV